MAKKRAKNFGEAKIIGRGRPTPQRHQIVKHWHRGASLPGWLGAGWLEKPPSNILDQCTIWSKNEGWDTQSCFPPLSSNHDVRLLPNNWPWDGGNIHFWLFAPFVQLQNFGHIGHFGQKTLCNAATNGQKLLSSWLKLLKVAKFFWQVLAKLMAAFGRLSQRWTTSNRLEHFWLFTLSNFG